MGRSNYLWVPLWQQDGGNSVHVASCARRTFLVAAAAQMGGGAWVDQNDEKELDRLEEERHTTVYRMYKSREMERGRGKKKVRLFKERRSGCFVLRSGVGAS